MIEKFAFYEDDIPIYISFREILEWRDILGN